MQKKRSAGAVGRLRSAKKRAKGEMFLKVSGIILILPGILRIIVTFGFTTILVVTAQMTGEGGAARLILMGILSLAGGGTGVTAGILALAFMGFANLV